MTHETASTMPRQRRVRLRSGPFSQLLRSIVHPSTWLPVCSCLPGLSRTAIWISRLRILMATRVQPCRRAGDHVMMIMATLPILPDWKRLLAMCLGASSWLDCSLFVISAGKSHCRQVLRHRPEDPVFSPVAGNILRLQVVSCIFHIAYSVLYLPYCR